MKFIQAMFGEFLSMLPRLSGWMLIAVAALVAVAVWRPELLGVSLYKLSLIPAAGVIGYWFDRRANKDSRPSDYCRYSSVDLDAPPVIVDKQLFIAAHTRRAIIIAACIIGVCLGA
ncbi:MAG: putative holin [Proteobacteria bacterium]|nr:putative holin [Pseudomonadota bacterium]MCL2306724.1 putative holin [Pseudomonadota bacterium]